MRSRPHPFRTVSGLCLLLGLMPAIARPQPPAPPPPLAIPRLEGPIRLDGVLDEPAWQQAVVVEVPFEIQPGDNTPAPVRTECLLAHDENYFYAGFRAYDEHPDQIRAHLTDRDLSFRDDFVGVMIDPFNDERRGFEFFVNPLGVQMDLAINDLSTDETEDETWDAIWGSAGRITAEGYIVEMAIPFTTLRFPRTEGAQIWGLIADRNYPRDIRHIFLSVPLDRDRMGMLCQAGKVTGMAGIRPGRSLEFDPTVTAHRTDVRPDPSGPMENGELRGDVGLSARWGITPNLSFNAAVNPDFSQVEADAVQLAINTRYALSFAEKRPFFMEAADFFATGLSAVYTRAVADPDWGVKLTGKEGAHAVGLFVARDAKPSLIFPSNAGSYPVAFGEPTTTAVARYRHDFGRAVTIGGLMTVRESDDAFNGGGQDSYFNRLAGIDGHIRFGPGDMVQFQALGTQTRYPRAIADALHRPARTFDGFGGGATFIHSRRDWTGWADYEQKDPGFRADAGFITRVDTRSTAAGLERIFRAEAGHWYTRINLEVNGAFTFDHKGERTDREVNLESYYEGPLQTSVEMDLSRLEERFLGRMYSMSYGSIHVEIQPHKNLKLWYTQRGGDAIDYENARPGVIFATGPGWQIDLGRHLSFYVDETYERFRVSGGTLYTTNVLDTRTVYQLNARAFLRAVVQYVTIDQSPSLYLEPAPPHKRDLFTQLLASYKINPQTVFYLGCTDKHDGAAARRMIGSGRTIFFKIGYAWLV